VNKPIAVRIQIRAGIQIYVFKTFDDATHFLTLLGRPLNGAVVVDDLNNYR